MMTDASQPVLLSVADGIARIRFNRPERLNAMDMELVEGFGSVVEMVLANDDVRVIVIAAEGRGFIAGGDLTYFERAADRGAAAHALIQPMHRAVKALVASPKISIGSLKGPAAGAGMSLALNLDLLVAAEDTVFTFAYGRVGTVPDCGGSYVLPRLLGARRALELALLGDSLDATEALRLGLVNRVVPAAELEAETMKLASRIATGATVAIGKTKGLLQHAFEDSFSDHLDAEERAFAECASTDDFGGAVSAFLQRRKHKFAGR